jgi:glycosyltransferase involved in cell wall biosynthesis
MGTSERSVPRIVINALSARQGGGQTYLINLLENLPDQWPSEIYVLAPERLELPTNNASIRRIAVDWPVENPFVRAIWERIYLMKLLSRLRADVLFCPGGIIGGRVPRGCKTVTMFRNMIPFSPKQRWRYGLGYMSARNFILKAAFLQSMQRADMVIFLSNYARTVIEQQLNCRLRKSVTISHGVAQAFRRFTAGDSTPAPAWLPPEGYFLYASTLDYYKAQMEVVQAYALLKQKRPTKEKLLLVGPEYPEYGRRVREQIKILSLENDVLITGSISYAEMPALYRNAVLNIFASQCENCPNTLIEALAAGRPVFSSNYPPMPEFAGGAPVYFDPTSPTDLAEKLANTLADSSLMEDLGEKARQQSQRFDWRSSAQATWDSILELAQIQ